MNVTSKKNDGVSPVIGTILLVAITVVLVAIISAVIMGMWLNDNSSNEQIPQLKTINTECMFIYIDQVTGVNYMMMYAYGGYGGVCPRYNADGTLYISGV